MDGVPVVVAAVVAAAAASNRCLVLRSRASVDARDERSEACLFRSAWSFAVAASISAGVGESADAVPISSSSRCRMRVSCCVRASCEPCKARIVSLYSLREGAKAAVIAAAAREVVEADVDAITSSLLIRNLLHLNPAADQISETVNSLAAQFCLADLKIRLGERVAVFDASGEKFGTKKGGRSLSKVPSPHLTTTRLTIALLLITPNQTQNCGGGGRVISAERG